MGGRRLCAAYVVRGLWPDAGQAGYIVDLVFIQGWKLGTQ